MPMPSSLFTSRPHLSGLGGETELGGGSTVKYNKYGLEEDVTVDGEADASVSLDTTEASWKKH